MLGTTQQLEVDWKYSLVRLCQVRFEQIRGFVNTSFKKAQSLVNILGQITLT